MIVKKTLSAKIVLSKKIVVQCELTHVTHQLILAKKSVKLVGGAVRAAVVLWWPMMAHSKASLKRKNTLEV